MGTMLERPLAHPWMELRQRLGKPADARPAERPERPGIALGGAVQAAADFLVWFVGGIASYFVLLFMSFTGFVFFLLGPFLMPLLMMPLIILAGLIIVAFEMILIAVGVLPVR